MRLNKTQKYAIEHLHSLGKSVTDISQELNISQSSVEKHVGSLPQPEKPAEPVVLKKSASDFMIKETQSGNKSRGVVIMTRQASMMADSSPKGQQPSSNGIFKPKG